MVNLKDKAAWIPIIVGIALIIIGLLLPIPGDLLTTYTSLEGVAGEGGTYSVIDEYVGGDAYNFIIGASLVGGKIAGVIAAKAIAIVGGILCACFGVTLLLLQSKPALKKGAEHTDDVVQSKDTAVNPASEAVTDDEQSLE